MPSASWPPCRATAPSWSTRPGAGPPSRTTGTCWGRPPPGPSRPASATCTSGWPGPSGSERGPPVAGEFEDIRKRLDAIAEELADLALERLRESIDAGGTELPVDERRLSRARRTVEKAVAILQEPDDL